VLLTVARSEAPKSETSPGDVNSMTTGGGVAVGAVVGDAMAAAEVVGAWAVGDVVGGGVVGTALAVGDAVVGEDGDLLRKLMVSEEASRGGLPKLVAAQLGMSASQYSTLANVRPEPRCRP
jgi:hypothetical protein